MWKSIFYKEWLKVRLAYMLSFITGVLAITGIYLTVRHTFIMIDAQDYWDGIINQRHIYFALFKYIPAGIGSLIALAQFIPEIKEKRIKLTLHLPLNEEVAGLKMISFGSVALFVIYLVLFMLFMIIGQFYFPYEIMLKAAETLLPWFFSGFACYYFVGLITIEPIWKYRVLYSILGIYFIKLFFIPSLAGAYYYAILPLLGMILLTSTSILFSIHRYRKGEM